MELMTETTKFITILRHPITQFTSLFKFMDMGGQIALGTSHKSISLDYFLDNAYRILNILHQHNSQILIEKPSLNLLRNPQLFDLGFDQSLSEDENYIREIIVRISKQFHLVLVMEYFDESLILLKRKMCWNLKDVVYFKLNKQIATNEDWKPGIQGKIMQWAKADVLLYEYFNKTLWDEIRNEGASFWDEVAQLRKWNTELGNMCLQSGVFIDRPYMGSTTTIYGHYLRANIPTKSKQVCKRMVRSEMKYIQYFRTVYH